MVLFSDGCYGGQITEVLKEETTHLSGITDSREQVEAGATSELNKCRGANVCVCVRACVRACVRVCVWCNVLTIWS